MPNYTNNGNYIFEYDSNKLIPIDPLNSDYQEYLQWLANGGIVGPPLYFPSNTDPVYDYSNIQIGASEIFGGTDGYKLYNNNGTLAEKSDIIPIVENGRLSLSNADPEALDNSLVSTLYYLPYNGNRISLYNNSSWEIQQFSGISISAPSVANTNYDVFIYSNLGTLTLELVAWSSGTARAVAIAYQDGVAVKTGDLTRRYIGTIRTFGASQLLNTSTYRYVWNMYNKIPAHFFAAADTNYTYTTNAWRSAGGVSTPGISRVLWVNGMNTKISFNNYAIAWNSSPMYVSAGIGIDKTTGNDAQLRGGYVFGTYPTVFGSFYAGSVTPGSHYAQRVEISNSSGTTTWYGIGGNFYQVGLLGEIWC